MKTIKTYNEYVKNVESQLEKGLKENPQFMEELALVSRPFNPIRKTMYKGVNRLNLMLVAKAYGYKDTRWYTFKDIENLGLHLKAKDGVKYKKGDQKCVEIWYFIPLYYWTAKKAISQTEYDKLSDEEKKHVTPRYFKSYVFNGEQIDGLTPMEELAEKNYSTKLIDHISQKLNVPITWNSDKPHPCYVPSQDKIYMPNKNAYKKERYMLATALHELSHSTGHSSRLNRTLNGLFGKKEYAMEELVAESSAAMLCAYLNIESTVDENHKAYIKSWLSATKDEPNALVNAFKEAERCCDYIIKVAELDTYEEQTELAPTTIKETIKNVVKKAKTKKESVKSTMKMTTVIEDGIDYLVWSDDTKWIKVSRDYYINKMSKADKKRMEKLWGIA